MESVESWKQWDTGLIPGLEQWVKDTGLLQLWCRSQPWLRSDPWFGNSICQGAAKKKKKKKERKKEFPSWRSVNESD